MKPNYFELTKENQLNTNEMFNLKAGYTFAYGCESQVCAVDRSGAKDLCTDAYCRSGVGTISQEQLKFKF